MPSTEEFVNAARTGDKAAFGQLVQLYERTAILTAQAILHDFHAAQDTAQESFVIAYGKLDQLRDARAFGPWILQIVRRQALSHGRSNETQSIEPEIAAPTTNPSADWSRQYEDVVEQLAGLPEQEHIVVILRYVDGLSVQEITDTLNKSVGTVTKQLSRAVHRLRTRLKVQS